MSSVTPRNCFVLTDFPRDHQSVPTGQLTGNLSPVAELEENASFYLQLDDGATQPQAVRSILSSFGDLLSFQRCVVNGSPHTGADDGQVSRFNSSDTAPVSSFWIATLLDP